MGSVPSYDGRGLVNLVSELERRLIGSSPSTRLDDSIAEHIPEAPTYVLVLFDGLGDHQLAHPLAKTLAEARVAALDAPFATTTTVSLATVVTGLAPRAHGVLGHLMFLPSLGKVVNTLKWMTPTGRPVEFQTEHLLPEPNLWERLRSAGREPVTVQPGEFATTPLTRALYRGCRFEGAWNLDEVVEATVVLAREPGRLILTYLPQIDFAAHVWGQESDAYRQAVRETTHAWRRIVGGLGDTAIAIGTADHGHLDYPHQAKHLVRDPAYDDLVFFGDPRSVFVNGGEELVRSLAQEAGAELIDTRIDSLLWGAGPAHPEFAARRPDWVLLAPPERLILPKGFDKRLIGYHGGLDPPERAVPLLVGAG